MFRYIVILLLALSLASPAWAAAGDEVDDALAHAEALYYAARYKESIELLNSVDTVLRRLNDRPQQKVIVKLQLALAHIGLNENVESKLFFRELFDVKPDYPIDPQLFPPKVINLADEARKEQQETRRRALCDDATQQLRSGTVTTVIDQLGSLKPKCPTLSAALSDAADGFYKKGIDAYKRDDFSIAIQQFGIALKLRPDHDLASQY